MRVDRVDLVDHVVGTDTFVVDELLGCSGCSGKKGETDGITDGGGVSGLSHSAAMVDAHEKEIGGGPGGASSVVGGGSGGGGCGTHNPELDEVEDSCCIVDDGAPTRSTRYLSTNSSHITACHLLLCSNSSSASSGSPHMGSVGGSSSSGVIVSA